MTVTKRQYGLAEYAFDAAGGDPEAALLLVLEAIWAGLLVVSRNKWGGCAIRPAELPETLAA